MNMNTDTDFPEDEHPKKENENCSNEDWAMNKTIIVRKLIMDWN